MNPEQTGLLRLMTRFAIGVGAVSGLANLAQGWSTGGPTLWSVGVWIAMSLAMGLVLELLRRDRLELAALLHVAVLLIGSVWLVLLDTPTGALITASLGPTYAGLVAVALLPVGNSAWWRWCVGLESMLSLLARHWVRPLPGVTWGDVAGASVAMGLATFALVTFVSWVVDQLSRANLEKQRSLERLKRSNRALEVAHDRALAASNAKAAFLAHMSHELRTPLNAVLGYSELLVETAELDEESAADVEKISVAANHLLSLIADVLDLSRVEAGQHRLSVDRVDAVALCHEVEPIVAGRFDDCTLIVESEACTLRSDPVAIRQILINLLENASRFTPAGVVTLSAAPSARQGRDGLAFEVRDTGCGIEPDFLLTIFAPFATTDGTGIGLALSRALAESLGGTLTATSEVGIGSTFRLWVPDLAQSIPDLDEQG